MVVKLENGYTVRMEQQMGKVQHKVVYFGGAFLCAVIGMVIYERVLPDDLLSKLGSLALLPVFVLVYLFPYFLAHQRGHRNQSAILALNLLLGWTLIGWVAALVWALTRDREA